MAKRRTILDEEFHGESALPLWREALLGIDWLSLRMSAVYLGIGIPHGDNSGVIVIPGFMGSDQYLGDMYAWLGRIGYEPYQSGIGRNAECPEILTMRLYETIDRAVEETGSKVHLIGHSLGGVIARGAAVRWPHMVSSVATMASPFRGVHAHPLVIQTAYLVRGRIRQRRNSGPATMPNCYSGECSCDFVKSLRGQFPSAVPRLAIYTKTDGVVDWRYCVNEDETDVQVPGTHVGLAFNPQAYRHIANFLAAPESYSRKRVA